MSSRLFTAENVSLNVSSAIADSLIASSRRALRMFGKVSSRWISCTPAAVGRSYRVVNEGLVMRLLQAVAIAAMCGLAAGVQAQSTQRIRGDIVSVEGPKLE